MREDLERLQKTHRYTIMSNQFCHPMAKDGQVKCRQNLSNNMPGKVSTGNIVAHCRSLSLIIALICSQIGNGASRICAIRVGVLLASQEGIAPLLVDCLLDQELPYHGDCAKMVWNVKELSPRRSDTGLKQSILNDGDDRMQC